MRVRKTILPIVIMGLPWVLLFSQNPVGTLSKGDADLKGWIMPAGDSRVLSGSTISAGQETATLHLNRGGEVRVCPGGSLSVSSSADGRELMLAIAKGGIEVDYSLAGTADSVITPDFRILLAGPGAFHFAMASDAGGNTCVRALLANRAGLVVNEAMGDGVYHVRSDEQVRFRHGNISEAEAAGPLDCGCFRQTPKLKAEDLTAPPPSPASSSASVERAPNSELRRTPTSATAPAPPLAPGDLHVTVDAPFVFRAAEMSIPPVPAVMRLRFETLPSLALLVPPQAEAPSASLPSQTLEENASRPKPKGLMGRIRSFFVALWALRTT